MWDSEETFLRHPTLKRGHVGESGRGKGSGIGFTWKDQKPERKELKKSCRGKEEVSKQ